MDESHETPLDAAGGSLQEKGGFTFVDPCAKLSAQFKQKERIMNSESTVWHIIADARARNLRPTQAVFWLHYGNRCRSVSVYAAWWLYGARS